MDGRVKVIVLAGWWVVSLLSVASLAAAGGDLRVVDAVMKGDKEAVRSLLKENADVNAPQPDGATALAWAVHRDDLETAELLINAAANVNAANDYGVTPLSLACTNLNAAMVEKLLKAGADPNAAQWTGETPLMTAARTGDADAVNSLLAHGADVNAKETRRGQTALMWAIAERHAEVARVLIEHGGGHPCQVAYVGSQWFHAEGVCYLLWGSPSQFEGWFHAVAVCCPAGRSGNGPTLGGSRSERK